MVSTAEGSSGGAIVASPGVAAGKVGTSLPSPCCARGAGSDPGGPGPHMPDGSPPSAAVVVRPTGKVSPSEGSAAPTDRSPQWSARAPGGTDVSFSRVTGRIT